MTCATNSGVLIPYLAKTAGAVAAMLSRSPGTFSSLLSQRLSSVLMKVLDAPKKNRPGGRLVCGCLGRF